MLVIEAAETIGGGTRTAELTLPGFRHDVCSAIHPLVAASPFFRRLGLDLDLVHPPAALAHPFDDGTALLVPAAHGAAYERLIAPALDMAGLMLGHVPCLARNPVRAGRFGWVAARTAVRVAERLPTDEQRALFLGASAHSIVPLDMPGTAGFGLLLLGLAHSIGWPFPRGGSQQIADALAERLRARGGRIETGRRIASLRDLPPAGVVLCDVTPRQLLTLGGDVLPPRYRQRLQRWRYGPGVFKVDYALDAPIPWRAAEVAQAGTVHLGSTPDEIVSAESAAWHGHHPERPFVLLAQQTLFDDTRAPAGKHTAWAYCHVPHGSTVDMRDAIERQIERFAPGFRERVLACTASTTADLERENGNLVGGDITGGANLLRRIIRPLPHATPVPWLFVCSASTAPGGGVHGMCGHLAAKAALRRLT